MSSHGIRRLFYFPVELLKVVLHFYVVDLVLVKGRRVQGEFLNKC